MNGGSPSSSYIYVDSLTASKFTIFLIANSFGQVQSDIVQLPIVVCGNEQVVTN